MQVPVEISFHHMVRSDAMVREIVEQAKKLEEICDCVGRCKVVVEAPDRQRNEGILYGVSIQLSLPNRDINAGSASNDMYSHVDPFIALYHAFEVIRCKLTAYAQDFGIDSKPCTGSPHGQITKICLSDGLDCPERGYGIISTCDGREVYFSAKSLEGVEFQRLELGSEVDFVEDEHCESGPEAVSVHVVGQQPHFVFR